MPNATPKKLVCPRCGTYWATLDISGYPEISAKHVRVVYGKKKKLKDGDSLKCVSCSHEYTTWDVVLASANSNDYVGLAPGCKIPSAATEDKENGEAKI